MRRREIIRNVSTSWFSLGVNILVGIFLSPFILHRLGNTAYGAWVLVFSVTGYYGLFDFGVRSSIVRYVSTYAATNDMDGLNRLLNTSLLGYSAIGALTMAVTVGLSMHIGSIFRMPAEFVPTARLLFLIVGASVAIGFPAGVFAGTLEGLGRFYVVNATSIVSTLLRAILIVLALNHGYGLIAVAIITVVLPFFGSAVRAAVVLHLLRLKFGWRYVSRAALRDIAQYSSVSFILLIAFKLRFKTDELVVSTFLSVAAVTFFSNADRLVDYTAEVVMSLAQIFLPMSGQSDAKGDTERLRRILIAGNRACALVVLPISAALIILGKSVLAAWVGQQYVAVSYPVMLILLIPSTLMLAQAASTGILYGMARHRIMAWVCGIEGVANLGLSIYLIRHLGLIGDALGTAIPLTCTSLFFLPRHLCRTLNVRLRSFLLQAYSLPVLLTLPTALMLLVMRRWFFAHTYLQVALQLIVGLSPYALGLTWAYWTGRIWGVEQHSQNQKQVSVAIPAVGTRG